MVELCVPAEDRLLDGNVLLSDSVGTTSQILSAVPRKEWLHRENIGSAEKGRLYREKNGFTQKMSAVPIIGGLYSILAGEHSRQKFGRRLR